MPAAETIDLAPVVVTDDSVAIDSQLPGRREQVVFSRHRAHAKLRRVVSPWHPSRLTIESHGRACEVGRINESPPMFQAATLPRSA
jgi:hypothetical protein